jgi:OmpA-OmpF porin, OOP family
MRFVFVVLIVFSFSADFVDAQNLVPNPGFEQFRFCPGSFNQRQAEFHVTDWRSANRGTPDHFHECSTGSADVPHNWAGVSQAREGQGYVGIYLWMSIKDYREFIQAKLSQPLIKDTLYSLQFHFKLSSYSRYAVDRIGLLLSDSIVSYSSDGPVKIEPTFAMIQDSALTVNTGAWERAHWTFRAKGGEQYITIGNFWGDQTKYYRIHFRNTPEEMLKDASYYYLDDVRLTPVYQEKQNLLVPEFEPTEIKINTTYVLRNIQFEFDSYKLLPSSFDEMDELAKYVLKNPHVKLQLSGHTDDRGGDKYNSTLSRNRASSVARYLMLQGIAADRIEIFGYGKSKPLVNDNTEQARAINRRVEIKFLEF